MGGAVKNVLVLLLIICTRCFLTQKISTSRGRSPALPGDSARPRIIGGEEAEKNEFPFMVRNLEIQIQTELSIQQKSLLIFSFFAPIL